MSDEQPDANKEMLQALRAWAEEYGARIEAINGGELRITRTADFGYYPHWVCSCIDEDLSFERVELEKI